MSGKESLRSLYTDKERYLKSFEMFLKNSSEHSAMLEWITRHVDSLISHFKTLGKTELKLLSVGCGDGQVDLVLIERIKHAFNIHVTLLDSSEEQIVRCKELLEPVSRTANEKAPNGSPSGRVTLEFVSDTFENFIDSHRGSAAVQFDLIYLVQMLYYVKKPLDVLERAVTSLKKDGSLFLIHVSGNSGYAKVWKEFGPRLPQDDMCNYTSASDIMHLLAQIPAINVKQDEIQSTFHIEGDLQDSIQGQLSVDFIVEAAYFCERAADPLKTEVLDFIRSSSCSVKKSDSGAIEFNNNLAAITVTHQ